MRRIFLFLVVALSLNVHAAQKDTVSKDTLFAEVKAHHSPVSYRHARELIFGSLYLDGHSTETYSLFVYYCNESLTNKDFSSNDLGPMQIPNNNIVNVEHAWPQSHFTGNFPKDFQKADLHILFPTRSHINSIRGNYAFGEVVKAEQQPCADAALGLNAAGERVFEPDDTIKGDMARATLYFSVRYKVKLDANQEEAVRRWHKMDPPDQNEIDLNEKIDAIQHNRNPFIDNPEFEGQIDDF